MNTALDRRKVLQALAGFAVQPYVNRNAQPLRYEGPGGDEPEPAGLTEVRIGYFGPAEGPFWAGAARAVEEANRAGGYKGLPFKLVAKWSDSPWTAGARLVAEMAFQDEVWAIIGSIDAAATHLAEQVAVKARLVLIDPASTDRTVNAAMVPWMFSVLPGDPAIAEALAPLLAAEAGSTGPALICSTGHDERHCAAEFRRYFATRQPGFAEVIDFEPGGTPRLPAARVVLVVANVRDTARIVKSLAGRIIYAGPAATHSSHQTEAFEGVRCPRLAPNATLRPGQDYPALAAYDAASILIAAIRRAGLNRIRICRELADLSPWNGAAGTLTWSNLNRNNRPVTPAVIRQGALMDFALAPISNSQGSYSK